MGVAFFSPVGPFQKPGLFVDSLLSQPKKAHILRIFGCGESLVFSSPPRIPAPPKELRGCKGPKLRRRLRRVLLWGQNELAVGNRSVAWGSNSFRLRNFGKSCRSTGLGTVLGRGFLTFTHQVCIPDWRGGGSPRREEPQQKMALFSPTLPAIFL